MTLPDLPEPQNKEQSAIFAKVYGDHIESVTRLKWLRQERIKAGKQDAPDWFLRMVDVEIQNILHRISHLKCGWGCEGDPYRFAADTAQCISVAYDMVINFLKPERMYFSGIGLAEAWLAEGDGESVKVDTLSKINP
ncbi:MAG TPA: hypothetical protein DIT05_08890 [Morganella sp. (in: Bacteria)]|nr:hypothetical protein [Morganella sp. (in: enterobacteria)]